MALITVQAMIAKAIDTRNAKLAGEIADLLRQQGCNYHEVLQRVQAERPNVTEAEWAALLYESEEEETRNG